MTLPVGGSRVCAVALLLVTTGFLTGCGQHEEVEPRQGGGSAEGRSPAAARRAAASRLFQGTVAIAPDLGSSSANHDGPTALDGMSLEQIAEFRRARVAEHAALGVFPSDYDPLVGPSSRIYSRITPGANWLGPTAYYVANPYLLIVVTCANHVTPLGLSCPAEEVTYTSARIEESVTGDSGRCWLARIVAPDYAEYAGSVRLVMVNAYDAGFPFAHLDLAASENLSADNSPANVARGLFSQSSFYHVGRYGVNNISPEDRNGWVRVIDPAAATRFVVKLWRQRPSSPRVAADFTYVVSVDPNG